jgi:D-glycero-D-manno-heptose 1,7-bisphosphate phosphatase
MRVTRKQRAVFLDRDGVLIRTSVRDGTPHPVERVTDVEILPGVCESLRLLAEHGLARIVVTNQPDVRRGTQTREAVEAIHAYLLRELPLSAVYTCYHDDVDACACRKPKPGLLLQAAESYDLDVERSFLIGDRWRDIGAGEAAGCTTFLVAGDYSQPERCRPDFLVDDIPQAVQKILELSRRYEPS